MFFVRKRIGTVDELLQIEAWFGIDDQELLNDRYDKALEALATEDIEAWLADAARAGVTEKSANRFKQDWMGGARVPGLASPDVQARMTEGFVDAITEAREYGRKLSIVFVLAEGASDFEVDHVVGTNAVTVVITAPIEAADLSNRRLDPPELFRGKGARERRSSRSARRSSSSPSARAHR